MKETIFIQQNKEKWQRFEKVLAEGKKDPDELSELFVEITNDLSYSRTYYPNRSVRYYLNNVAQKIFVSVYKNRRLNGSGFLRFWTNDLPYMLYHARWQLLISLLTFLLAMGIGVLSSIHDPEFYTVVMGEEYIDMTLENIENGDPMAVYKSKNQTDMFLGITLNNIRVAFLTFAMGVFAAIGSIFIMIYNGIMVGSFQYFFYEQGLFQASFLTIWMHGALEISAIIIAGAAGLVMGSGLVFPGTHSRLQAFQMSALKGLKIMLGIAPIIIIAGFIEGFVTRHTELPDILRLCCILASFGFILTYFVWYPFFKSKRGFAAPPKPMQLPVQQEIDIDFQAIKDNASILGDVVLCYRKAFKQLLLAAVLLSFGYALTTHYLFSDTLKEVLQGYDSYFEGTSTYFLNNIVSPYFAFDWSHWLYRLNLVVLVVIAVIVYGKLYEQIHFSKKKIVGVGTRNGQINESASMENQKMSRKEWGMITGKCLVIVASYLLLGYLPEGAGFALYLTLPFVLLWLYGCVIEKQNLVAALMRSLRLSFSHFGMLLGLYLLILVICRIYLFLLSSPLMAFYIEIVQSNLVLTGEQYLQFGFALNTFLAIFSLSILLPFFLYAFALLHHSLVEIEEAPALKREINDIQIKKLAFGLEKEG